MIFFEFDFKCEIQFICELFKIWKFISRVLHFRKMQIICQNAQQQNVYLLVHLLELFGQNKSPLINKNREGRIIVEIRNSITLCVIVQKLWLSSQNVQENNI